MILNISKKHNIKIHLNIDREKHIRYTKFIILGLSVLLVVLFLFTMLFGVAGIGDKTAPNIRIKDDNDYIIAYVGEGISFKSQLDVTDNLTSASKISVKTDSSKVNTDIEGDYYATVTATDKKGNKSTQVVVVRVYAERVTWDKLQTVIAPIAKKIIDDGMSAEEKCREIYSYVRAEIDYYDYSDKSNWMQAAYYGLRDGKGDCFTYYSVAKAFLEYYGIDNEMVQRKTGKTSGTHFWSVVNIGDASSPRWYHFDCTRLSPDKYHMGCLMTDAQLEEYNQLRGDTKGNDEDYYFYYYDSSKLPKIQTTIITPVG